jgi:hypothetical protein
MAYLSAMMFLARRALWNGSVCHMRSPQSVIYDLLRRELMKDLESTSHRNMYEGSPC